jgi:hypothetical protein
MPKISDKRRLHLFEMVTIGAQTWDEHIYSIQLHGASPVDRPVPHIHIYRYDDAEKKLFNFEVSLPDLLLKNEINLIYQFDKARNVRHIKSSHCTWNGYGDIYNGLRNYLYGPVQSPGYKSFCSNNIDVAVYAWNIETDADKTMDGGNPLKDWMEQNC